ncbi:dCTP deaminase [Staphylococcus pettenkoferi]|uniref:dCTP deaminase n=1 Tax=Staphylococcus pettenkoferi TaxID=170573 RepID=UPI001C8CC353|nr:dCTP deaminase [Staphylococcus pettenkoferi]MBX8994543.1 dCTP deaminase [Staphylococcus pettenkoferi]
MILSDRDIKHYINQGKINIFPLNDEHIEPASIDLTLGNTYLLAKNPQNNIQSIYQPFDYKKKITNKLTIPAKSFVLATTKEYIKIDNHLTGFVEGRSSIGRAGLFIQNAGWVDPGFEGNITLELYNANNFSLVLYENLKICQIVIAETKTPSALPYKGKYQHQSTTVGSKNYQDLINKEV